MCADAVSASSTKGQISAFPADVQRLPLRLSAILESVYGAVLPIIASHLRRKDAAEITTNCCLA